MSFTEKRKYHPILIRTNITMPLVLFILMGACLNVFAQPKLDFSIKKPPQFQERQLGSEKSASKNFHIVRRFWQNTYTHYNYYFNANNLVKEIIDQAKLSAPDDFTELLNYYPWSLENTSKSSEIDSILITCTAGILLHDLRNDWIDNMYLLMGKAYYLRKDFDSASMAFQYLNYSFAPKEKDGYDKPIGSNANKGTNAFTVLSKEKKAYIMSRPPSRNDGFVWAIRNLTDNKNYLDASSLVSILRNDPNFPKRLDPELSEASGYLFYKLSMWDSAATYLERAMPLAEDPSDKSRRWYLAGQLYQLAGDNQKAAEAFAKCSNSATDLVMDVYARLSSIRLRKNEDPKYLQENIDDLVNMAKKDKYTEYRDIIYYAAAMVELERNGYEEAANLLLKSVETNTRNAKQRTLSLLKLGDTRFIQKSYGLAAGPYDTLSIDLLKEGEAARVTARKPGCLQIYTADKVIYVQDSLMKLADMPEDERAALVKKLSNQLRKKMGLTDELTNTGIESNSSGFTKENEASNLFAATGSTWYFYEPNIRASGFNKFKERWGARPNEDNWRRSSALGIMASKQSEKLGQQNADPDGFSLTGAQIEEVYDSTDISYDNLYSRIPLSVEKRTKAENMLIAALFSKALALHEKIEDYPEAIKVYEEILRRRDTGMVIQKTLFNLVHCYTKTGDSRNAQIARARLAKEFPDGSTASAAIEPSDNEEIVDATYEKIYGLFLEGNFKEALSQKKQADSLLGPSYWKPQLLYIQSIYHIKEREDSLAIAGLSDITSLFSKHPLADKATVMIDVLKRRKDIEAYLTKLEVTRLKEDEYDPIVTRPSVPVIAVVQPNPVADSSKQKEAQEAADLLAKEKADEEKQIEKEQKAQKEAEEKAEAQRKADEVAASKKAENDRIAAEIALAEKQKADKIAADKALADQLAAEKAKADKELADKLAAEKAKAEKELAEKQKAEREALEKETTNRAEAEKALAAKQAREKQAMEKELAAKQKAEKAKADKELAEKLAAEKLLADKLLAEWQASEKLAADNKAKAKLEADQVAAEKERVKREADAKARAGAVDGVFVGTPTTPSPYTIRAGEKQTVAIVLEKIDPAYVNEVSYAFTNSGRGNSDKAEITVSKRKIKEGLWFVEIQSPAFENMQSSYEYIKYITPITRNELITWLDASKYYFITISEENLKEVIEKNGNIHLYRKVLQEAVPGKF